MVGNVRFGSKADIQAPSCPLYPQKRTWISTSVMSALCQKRTLRSRNLAAGFAFAMPVGPLAGSIIKPMGESMGLSWQQGPLSTGAIGRFLVPEPLPKRLLYVE